MGVHARRAARRTTPLVAAAAGIGTVAAMLANPLPASAASYIGDLTYGKTSASDPNVDRAARGGFTDTLGIGAVTIETNRYVLGQRVGGTGPRPIRVAKFDVDGKAVAGFGTAGVSTFIGGTGGTAAIPSTFSASQIVTDGVDLYVVGTARAHVVVLKLSATTGALDAGYSGDGVAEIADDIVLPDDLWGAGVVVADASVTAGVLTLAVQAESTGGSRDNRVVRLDAAGAPDATFGADLINKPGYAGLPAALRGALSLGGITVDAGVVTGTAQVFGTVSDSQSLVYQLKNDGTPDDAIGVEGLSLALEEVFDSASFKWSNEAIADLVNTPTGVMVSGRAGSKLFLAKLLAAGGIDATFNDTGVSDTVTSGCSTGEPEFAGLSSNGASGARYWLANDCGSTGEIVRWRTSGAADVDFGSGGLVRLNGSDFGFTGSTTAEPITFTPEILANPGIPPVIPATPGIPATVTVGAGTISNVVSQPQYDIAGWRLVKQDAAAITSQPSSMSVAVLGDATFTVAVTGSPTPVIQWQSAAPGTENWSDLSNGMGISQVDQATLKVSGVVATQNGTRFRAKVSNGGAPLYSSPATLTITGTPEITSQPANKSVAIGATNTAFTASYIGNTPVTASWEMKTKHGDSWVPATGGNISISASTGASTLTVTEAMGTNNGTMFRVVLSNALGKTTSVPATLEVTGIPTAPEPDPEEPNLAWGDYDGDGKTDIATFRPSTGAFNWLNKPSRPFGKPGDIPVVGNYDGDPVDDAAVFRPSKGTWHIDGESAVPFGRAGDVPLSGDFDGDGENDIAVFRPSTGTWHIQGKPAVAHGRSGDIPVQADYDGDGADEIAVFRPSNGTWYIKGRAAITYGRSGDIPVWGDFDSDGQSNIVLYRPSNGTWYVRGGDTTRHGRATDLPLSGDFDGDGQTDIAVYRPANSTWYIHHADGVKFGNTGDWPLPR
jgi:hypothetical protein